MLFLQSNKKTVVVAQLVRASDCDSEGRGFEPPRLPQPKPNIQNGFGFFMPVNAALIGFSILFSYVMPVVKGFIFYISVNFQSVEKKKERKKERNVR